MSGSGDLNPLAAGHALRSAGPESLEPQIRSEQDKGEVLLIFPNTQHPIQLFLQLSWSMEKSFSQRLSLMTKGKKSIRLFIKQESPITDVWCDLASRRLNISSLPEPPASLTSISSVFLYTWTPHAAPGAHAFTLNFFYIQNTAVRVLTRTACGL